jgi:hypothetical protein
MISSNSLYIISDALIRYCKGKLGKVKGWIFRYIFRRKVEKEVSFQEQVSLAAKRIDDFLIERDYPKYLDVRGVSRQFRDIDPLTLTLALFRFTDENSHCRYRSMYTALDRKGEWFEYEGTGPRLYERPDEIKTEEGMEDFTVVLMRI